MFHPIENGSCIEIPDNAFGFVYECRLPPVGYGRNSANGKIEKTDILLSSEIPEEQFWERPTLPRDWNERRKKEKQVQKIDRTYFDPYLEEIRVREWGRRLRGVWFWNYNPKTKSSVLEYMAGVHYFMLTHWKFQGKYFDFRIPDRNFWYVVKYCEDDPNCLGTNDIEKRKGGKTARLGAWIYERTSRMNNHHGGLQSKSDDDAWEVFKKGIIHPWKTLVDFFRPRYDIMKGDDPNDELRLFASSRRGAKAEEDDDDLEEPLNSFIDFKPSTESAYDGPEVDTYGADEAGKTKKPVSIKERQNVVRYCAEIDGEFLHRKQLYITTVEPEKGEEENYEFQDLTANSNPLERDANGRTGTGLYTYFLPAQKGMFFDKYGYPDEARALTFLGNTKKMYEEKGDTRGLSSFKRKNPTSLKEAFSTDGEHALYNPELLNNQLDDISWSNIFTERGDLVWKDGNRIKVQVVDKKEGLIVKPSEVVWVDNPHGKFEKIKGWIPREPNKVYFDNGIFYPNNDAVNRAGIDPFKYDKTKDKRRSNCAGFVYQLPDTLFPSQWDDSFVLRYAYREESTRAANEDILKMLWWCGCKGLFERNVNHWKRDFIDWECHGFLMYMPNEVEPGIATNGDVIQNICNYTEAYINQHIKKVFFKTLIRKETGWLGFKVEDTEKFDEPMGAGMTLINVKSAKVYSREPQGALSDYFPNTKLWQYNDRRAS